MAVSFMFGAMRSGKSESLCDDYKLELLGKDRPPAQGIAVFKPCHDTRSEAGFVTSRTGASVPCIQLKHDADIRSILGAEPCTVFVDEVQFMDAKHVAELCAMSREGQIDVNFYGLDKDYKNQLFANAQYLFQHADFLDQLTARCDVCGEPASCNHLNDNEREADDLGFIVGDGEYLTLCQKHFHAKTKEPFHSGRS